MLKIRVMNVSKQDLGKTLKRYKGTAWDQIPLFKKLYEEEYGQFGGEPFGCARRRLPLRPHAARRRAARRDVEDRAPPRMRRSSPAPPHALMQMDSWQELANPRDLTKIFTTPEYAAWRSLRESDDARYLGHVHAALPRRACRTARRPARSTSSTSRKTPSAPTHDELQLGQRGLRDGRQHQPLVQAVRLVLAHPRRRVRRRGREPADAHLPDRRRRRRHEVPDRDRHLRPARGRAVEERLPADDPSQELRLRRLHRRAVAAEAGRVRRPRRDRQRGARPRACRTCSPATASRTT